MFHLDCFAYGYLKKTAELNPYGVVAQALEPDEKTKKINLYFFPSPNAPGGYHGYNCDILAMGIISLKYAHLTKNPLFARIAVDQVDWVLGKNPFGFSMVIGIGETNPDSYHNEFNKGPVKGAIVNGIIAKEDGNIPVWGSGALSQEYWKVHSAMMLALIAKIETELLKNPFKCKEKKFNLNKLYKKIDKYLVDN